MSIELHPSSDYCQKDHRAAEQPCYKSTKVINRKSEIVSQINFLFRLIADILKKPLLIKEMRNSIHDFMIRRLKTYNTDRINRIFLFTFEDLIEEYTSVSSKSSSLTEVNIELVSSIVKNYLNEIGLLKVKIKEYFESFAIYQKYLKYKSTKVKYFSFENYLPITEILKTTYCRRS